VKVNSSLKFTGFQSGNNFFMLPQLRENSDTSGNAKKVGLVSGFNFKYQGGNKPPSMP